MSAQETLRLRAQLERLLPNGKTLRDIAEAAPVARGTRRSRLLVDRRRLMRKLEEGLDLTANETFYLRSIILPERRPVIDVLDGSYDDVLHGDWTGLNNPQVKARMEAAIAAVGRVELVEANTVTPVGTGFLVGQDLLMTNRHVAYEFEAPAHASWASTTIMLSSTSGAKSGAPTIQPACSASSPSP
jgi:hypothetical protein